ncbi:hypothetical protein IAU60_001721 [Kwoniella sp. DSM 27419]
MPSTIFTLPSISGQEGESSTRDQIEAGLLGTSELTVPGSREEDKAWAYKRSVPTVVLYDEQGLRLYDQITSHATEYYLFQDELNLLKEHGDEIARSMGFPGMRQRRQSDEDLFEEDRDSQPEKPWKPARWGDQAVGKYNGGVNGEEGLGGGAQRGYDVVELGAGALRKTAYLLTALSSALAADADDATIAPISYHPLDLSHPELDRVLGEMDESFGSQLHGRVKCVGLHGDYEAGIKFIREGGLATLRAGDNASQSDSASEDVVTSALDGMHIPNRNQRREEDNPLLSPESVRIVTPPYDPSPLPGAMSESDLAMCGLNPSSNHDSENGSGGWSPMSDSIHNAAQHKDKAVNGWKAQGTQAKAGSNTDRPLHLVFLGSSLGNFDRDSAAPFLRSLPLKAGDTLLLGLDGRPEPGHDGKRKVELAYNDPAGYTKAFEEHGWEVVRQQLGLRGDAGVAFVGRYNEELGRHEAYFKSNDNQTLCMPGAKQQVTLEKDELLNIEWSYKYSYAEALELFDNAHLRIVNSWKAPDSEYRLWLLERPAVLFPKTASNEMIAKVDVKESQEDITQGYKGVPTLQEWTDLWKFWDHITLEMIPKEMLHKKPIDLRHICLFYLGHIPTFLDIHLTRMTKGAHTEPEYFKTIFERGIDPDVDDPTKCHDHSEVPMSEEDWPSLPEIIGFRDRVRSRLRTIYEKVSTDEMAFSRHVGRVLFMTYEHEAMHAETLLYMLAQSDMTRQPTATSTPRFDILAKDWAGDKQENRVLTMAGGEITLGHRDLEAEDKEYPDKNGWKNHEFGWDNEHPESVQSVKSFKVDSLPVSNADYMSFLEASGKTARLTSETAPASWVQVDGVWKVRSFYGPQGFDVAGSWPLMASKLELEAFARSKGGRLPTEAELRSLWASEDGPRVEGWTSNTGVKNWHPTPPTNTYTDHAGKVVHGHNGGVWEWTDTAFDGYKDFVPSVIYPGYSADFFDGKHFVVLGGSWATVPSISGRRSFRNWYQANYRFSFIGGRVAYDA